VRGERALFGRYVFGGHASRTSYAMSESAISPLCGFERGIFGVVGDGAAGSERDGERLMTVLMGGETRRAKSLRIGVHHANGVVWGPV
jgi:hypothetical protein